MSTSDESCEPAEAGALCLHDGDDVAVVRVAGRAGAACVVTTGASRERLVLATDVPFGHKVALRAVRAGERVTKYGQPIGVALADIPRGAHVHVHNLAGLDAGASTSR